MFRICGEFQAQIGFSILVHFSISFISSYLYKLKLTVNRKFKKTRKSMKKLCIVVSYLQVTEMVLITIPDTYFSKTISVLILLWSRFICNCD